MITIYEIGGSVRDKLMGVKPNDIDFAVEASNYTEMVKYIQENGGKIYLERPEFLTVRARYMNTDADFVLCRKDGYYSDGRRPDTVEVGTIYDDLARRDFTINAIAVNFITREIIDPHNGIGDFQKHIIRTVGKADDRFYEDELRLLRAIRFHIKYGYELSNDIQRCLRSVTHINRMLNTVSEDRIRQELYKMFSYDTGETLIILEEYPELRTACFNYNLKIWLKPTVEGV